MDAIGTFHYEGGTTNTADALLKMNTDVFTEANGARRSKILNMDE